MRRATLARVKELGFRSYAEYLRSPVWLSVRARLSLPEHCAVPGCTRRKLHIHHASYDRLGQEAREDLVVLCSVHHRGLHSYAKMHRIKLDVAHLRYIAWLQAGRPKKPSRRRRSR